MIIRTWFLKALVKFAHWLSLPIVRFDTFDHLTNGQIYYAQKNWKLVR